MPKILFTQNIIKQCIMKYYLLILKKLKKAKPLQVCRLFSVGQGCRRQEARFSSPVQSIVMSSISQSQEEHKSEYNNKLNMAAFHWRLYEKSKQSFD